MERSYHAELKAIREKIILMAEKAAEATRVAISALETWDAAQADRAILMDDGIDQLENEVNQAALRYLSLRHPVASDLRLLMVSIRCSSELERIGDEATSIAKRVRKILLEGGDNLVSAGTIPQMAEMALDMLRDSVNALANGDPDTTIEIIRRDKKIDAVNQSHFDRFTRMASDNEVSTKVAVEFILISKSIERIGDHAANVAEENFFLFSGSEIRHTGVKSADATIPPLDRR